MTMDKTDEDFGEWELDRDIPQKVWNNYLSKYSGNYATFRDDDGCIKLRCKWGWIEPYSIKKGYLMFCGIFPTPLKKTYFIKRIKEKGFEVKQEGYNEIVVKFDETPLFLARDILFLKPKRIMSEAQKEALRKLIESSKQYRFKKKVKPDGKGNDII